MPANPDHPPRTTDALMVSSSNHAAMRRRRAVRTALILGAITVAIYVAFILSGVVGG